MSSRPQELPLLQHRRPPPLLLSPTTPWSTSSASSAVVVLDSPGGGLVGEIALAACRSEGVAAAIAVLSAGELVAYVGGGGSRPDRPWQAGEAGHVWDAPTTRRNCSRSRFSTFLFLLGIELFYVIVVRIIFGRRIRRRGVAVEAGRMGRTSEAIVCRKGSSLVAMMAQALAHRVGHVWVVVDDNCVAGVVTISDVVGVFRDHLRLLADTSLV